MSQKGTLFGVALGALIVGATLTIHKALDDPDTAAEMKASLQKKYATVREKVGGASAAVCGKVSAGCAVVREKAEEAGRIIHDRFTHHAAEEEAAEEGAEDAGVEDIFADEEEPAPEAE